MTSIAKFDVEFFDSGELYSVTVTKDQKVYKIAGPNFDDKPDRRSYAIEMWITLLSSLLRENVFPSDTLVYVVEKIEGGVKVIGLGKKSKND